MATLYRYRGRRVRPLTTAERRQTTALALGVVLGMITLLAAAALAVKGGDRRLVMVLVQSGALPIVATFFWSQRAQWSARQRRFHAVIVAVLALGWAMAVVEYFRGTGSHP
jgi:hypothetical protein